MLEIRRQLRMEHVLALVIIVAGLVFSLLSPAFLTLPNLVDLLESYAVTTILASGVFVVLVSGGIDVSFAAITSVSQYIAASLAIAFGLDPVSTVAIACLAGLALGCVNAALVHALKVVSIIVTIATASIFYALLIVVTDGLEIYNIPDWWTDRWVIMRIATAPGDTVRITWSILISIAVAVLTHLIMAHTRIGRQVYALGGNPDGASRIGINVLGVELFAYGYLGLLAGIAGIVQAHRIQEVVPTSMVGQELNVLAVAILGGASLVGGIGTMTGVMLGVLLLGMLQNGLNLIGVSPYFFKVVTGLTIIIATGATALIERAATLPRGRLRNG
jgi:simple sugar transport system permease protein